MKTAILVFILITTFLVPSGCNVQEGIPAGSINLDAKAAHLVTVSNQFGFDLYRSIWNKEEASSVADRPDNLMVSPLSVALALAMTYNGAETTTKAAMEETLRLKGLTRDEINNSYLTLVKALIGLDPKVLLSIANSIYYRQGFEVETDFVSLNKKYYDAEVSPLDFASPAAVDIINDWVDRKTNGKITEILKEITPNQVMFLLNAIYFKGSWATEFNKQSTKTEKFNPETGPAVDVDMMNRLDTLDYAANSLFSAIRLPYGSGSYNMFVFLPSEGKQLNDLVQELNPENWETWMKQFKKTTSVQIKLPRFTFGYEIKLNNVLTDMGMGIAFTGAADFTGINRSGGLNIDYVKHKTFVEVNEEGTEAAAVTIVAIEKNMAGPPVIPFYANHPFLFAITEKSTGAILFLGTVKNPAGNK